MAPVSMTNTMIVSGGDEWLSPLSAAGQDSACGVGTTGSDGIL